MYLTIDTNNFNKDHMVLSDKIKNNILNNSDFYRLYYSTPNITFNGVFIDFNLSNITIEKYFDKIKCCFEKNKQNIECVNKILNIEKQILKNCGIFNNIPIYRIEEQLQNNFIKIFVEKHVKIGNYKNKKFVLKISGIWATSSECGITFRFFIY